MTQRQIVSHSGAGCVGEKKITFGSPCLTLQRWGCFLGSSKDFPEHLNEKLIRLQRYLWNEVWLGSRSCLFSYFLWASTLDVWCLSGINCRDSKWKVWGWGFKAFMFNFSITITRGKASWRWKELFLAQFPSSITHAMGMGTRWGWGVCILFCIVLFCLFMFLFLFLTEHLWRNT